MIKRTCIFIGVLFILLALFEFRGVVFDSVHPARAQSTAPHIHLSACDYDGCDYLFAVDQGCTNADMQLNLKGIWDSSGVKIGQLSIWIGNGCRSLWVAVQNVNSNHELFIEDNHVSQTQVDAEDAYCSLGNQICTPHLGWPNYQVTRMLGINANMGQSCFFGHSKVLEDNNPTEYITNTDTFCYSS